MSCWPASPIGLPRPHCPAPFLSPIDKQTPPVLMHAPSPIAAAFHCPEQSIGPFQLLNPKIKAINGFNSDRFYHRQPPPHPGEATTGIVMPPSPSLATRNDHQQAPSLVHPRSSKPPPSPTTWSTVHRGVHPVHGFSH
jgi:hypothetical protein